MPAQNTSRKTQAAQCEKSSRKEIAYQKVPFNTVFKQWDCTINQLIESLKNVTMKEVSLLANHTFLTNIFHTLFKLNNLFHDSAQVFLYQLVLVFGMSSNNFVCSVDFALVWKMKLYCNGAWYTLTIPSSAS